MTTSTRTAIAAIALGLSSAVLTACGAAESAETPTQGSPADGRIAQEAENYVGDPWERRYREQFWAKQHWHDSWNPCHLGEKNVPKSEQGQGPECYSRLRSQTGR